MASMPITATKLSMLATPGASPRLSESLLGLLQKEPSNSRRLRVIQTVVIKASAVNCWR